MDSEARRFTLRGRGTDSNHAGRFEALVRTVVDDGWPDDAPLPVLRTQTRIEVPRRIISYNTQHKLDGLQPTIYAMAVVSATFVHKNTGTHTCVKDNIPEGTDSTTTMGSKSH